jgi:hypothetical protein
MSRQITKEFVIKKIKSQLEYYDNFLKMLDANPGIKYSDEQFELDNDISLECEDLLKRLQSNEISPQTAFEEFETVVHCRL